MPQDVDKLYRLSLFSCLSGLHVDGYGKIPIFDEVKTPDSSAGLYVVFLGQKSSPNPIAIGLYGRLSTIQLGIIDRTTTSVSKDAVDLVGNAILERLFPNDGSFCPSEPTGLQYCNPLFTVEETLPLNLSTTENVVAKMVTISLTIIEK